MSHHLPVMADRLTTLLSPGILRHLAGARTFQRGEDYAVAGKVRDLVEEQGEITASVRGTGQYRVRLWQENGDLAFACTCPIGSDGGFCKHCVAVALVWLSDQGGDGGIRPVSARGVGLDDIRAHLAGRSKDSLIELLLDQAARDEQLYDRLLLETASRRPKGPDLAALRKAIDRAVDPGEFVDYRSAYAYVTGVDEVIDTLDRLIRQGDAAAVVELTEYAVAAVDEAMGSVDDSDGLLGGVLQRLGDLHRSACIAARPDPVKLASRLFKLEMSLDSESFLGAAARYADVLGTDGRATYQSLAATEWKRVRALGPGEQDPDRYGKRFRITHIMETLAQESSDVETLVEVKRRDLSHAFAYLEIAELYQKAGQSDQALEWAERGVAAFPTNTDSRLREFLADEYHRRGRHEEAMGLIWAEFNEDPTLEGYKRLKVHAGRTREWSRWRERALAFLRQLADPGDRTAGRRVAWTSRPDHSDLVRVFLWEKDVEAAWHEAVSGGCAADLWLELAARRETEHPEDAVRIYRAALERTVALKHNAAYEQAIRLLGKVAGLMTRLGKDAALAAYLLSVRAAHKPKRNFIKLFDRAYPQRTAEPLRR
jgi:uncharacterized Zn finger protein